VTARVKAMATVKDWDLATAMDWGMVKGLALATAWDLATGTESCQLSQ
jgi:hypothetical protein